MFDSFSLVKPVTPLNLSSLNLSSMTILGLDEIDVRSILLLLLLSNLLFGVTGNEFKGLGKCLSLLNTSKVLLSNIFILLLLLLLLYTIIIYY